MRKAQQVIKCDGCDEKIVKKSTSMDHTKKIARRRGWSIGKYDYCPSCR